MKDVTTGWLCFMPDEINWRDAIQLVDDDGVPFVMDWAKPFHGKAVRITIEVISEKVANLGEPQQPDPRYFKFAADRAPAVELPATADKEKK